MSSATFEFQDAQVKKLLDGLINKVDKISDLHKEVVGLLSVIVYRDVIDHFEKESGPDGKWAAWSDRYRTFMQSIGKGGNNILQDTGFLRQNFRPNNYRVQGDEILWYNNAKTKDGFPYAAAHNEGGPKLPKREFMWLSDDAINDMRDALVAYLEK